MSLQNVPHVHLEDPCPQIWDLKNMGGESNFATIHSTRMWPSGARPALTTLQQWVVCRDWSRSVVHPFSEMLIQSSKFKNVVPI